MAPEANDTGVVRTNNETIAHTFTETWRRYEERLYEEALRIGCREGSRAGV